MSSQTPVPREVPNPPPRLLILGKCKNRDHAIKSMADLTKCGTRWICRACKNFRRAELRGQKNKGIVAKQIPGMCRKNLHDLTLPDASYSNEKFGGRQGCRECRKERNKECHRRKKASNGLAVSFRGGGGAYRAEVTLDCKYKHTLLFRVSPKKNEELYDPRCNDYFPIIGGRAVYWGEAKPGEDE